MVLRMPGCVFVRRGAGSAALAAVLLAAGVPGGAEPATASTPSAAPSPSCGLVSGSVQCVFAATGAEQIFVVPHGVASVRVTATGGFGGTASLGGARGGVAAVVTATIPVTSVDRLYVEVGGPGGSSGSAFNGGGQPYGGAGGGGGASDVRSQPRTASASLQSRLVVAGGGGGGAATAFGGAGGSGGSAGSAGTPAGSQQGGGGTSTAGGTAGLPGGQAGGFGYGGSDYTGSTPSTFGGAGGGGWYGGGSGGNPVNRPVGQVSVPAGGGGGGSSFGPAGTVTGLASGSLAPSVVITYPAQNPGLFVQFASAKCVTDVFDTVALEPCLPKTDPNYPLQIFHGYYLATFGAYMFSTYSVTQCLTAYDTTVKFASCDSSDPRQHWRASSTPWNSIVLVQASSGLVLDTNGGRTDDGTLLVVAASSGSFTQQWVPPIG